MGKSFYVLNFYIYYFQFSYFLPTPLPTKEDQYLLLKNHENDKETKSKKIKPGVLKKEIKVKATALAYLNRVQILT